MTRIYLGRDEWWPVPEVELVAPGDPGGIDIDQALIEAYRKAGHEFNRASNAIAQAAADAGDKYWQDHT